MSFSDLYLMALGPVLALAAGLFIYLSATIGPGNSGETARGSGDRFPPAPERGEGR